MNVPDPLRRALDSDPARKAAEEGRYLVDQLGLGLPQPWRWLWDRTVRLLLGIAVWLLVVIGLLVLAGALAATVRIP